MPRPADPRAKIELLRAAEAVFVDHGLNAAKVEDITARAGVSKGAFYLHFDSKDDCFRQIVDGLFARLVECIESHPKHRCCGSWSRAIEEHLEATHAHNVEIFEFCWQNRALLGMVLAGGGGAPFAYLTDEFPARVASYIERTVRDMIGARVYRPDLDAKLVPALVAGAYEQLARLMIRQPKRPDIAAWCGQALGLFSRGLYTEEARVVVDCKVTAHASASQAADPPEVPGDDPPAPRKSGPGKIRERVGQGESPRRKRVREK